MGLITLILFSTLVIAEVMLVLLVSWLRDECPWLITKEDESPTISDELASKYCRQSFDARLGWTRHPNSVLKEEISGQIKFIRIGSSGARVQQDESKTQKIAVFGDSYAFCRQSDDNDTWEEELSRKRKVGVLNFGVGNYGIDQALLRYEETELPDSVSTAILCFVPETICRIQSVWKHYFEFGNILAFKPRFVLTSQGSALTLLPNPVCDESSLRGYQTKLSEIKATDPFYLRRFRSYQFRVPFLLTLIRRPVDSIRLLIVAIRYKIAKTFGSRKCFVYKDQMFGLVVNRNARETRYQYQKKESRNFLMAILTNFAKTCEARGHRPLIVVIPQKQDLDVGRQERYTYSEFFSKLSKSIDCLDLTRTFERYQTSDLFTNDVHGGHLSAYGNRIVASRIHSMLELIGEH
jgi:hypothetical protein